MFEVNNLRVRELILKSGLTMAAFAAQSGLNQLTLRRVLKDGAKAKIPTIAALAKFFNVDAAELIKS